jgi:hypothetical protein
MAVVDEKTYHVYLEIERGASELKQRLATIEAHIEHFATREDIKDQANKSLKWTVGIMITSLIAAVSATAAVMGGIAG